MQEEKKASLILQDGTVFEGVSLGAEGSTIGEAVFTTGAVGFQETITSPAFCGQIVVQTFPLTGNYGVNDEVNEAENVQAAGYVVREACAHPSNFRSEGTLDEFLKRKNVIGISGIDTRALTIHLRKNGVANACITTEVIIDKPALLKKIAEYKPQGLMERVSCKAVSPDTAQNGRYNVVLYDFGCDASIVRLLEETGCNVIKAPYNTKLESALHAKPHGVIIAGGPECPDEYAEHAKMLAPLLNGSIPVLGLGLGHQLLAVAAGASVSRLPQAHRGANQAVRDERLGRTFVTAQNHAFAVDESTLSQDIAEVFCRNINDKSCEGIRYKNAPAFSVQFSPSVFTGTENTHYYIDEFVKMMNGGAK